MKPETIAIHAGNQIDKNTQAVIQPITLSTTYVRGHNGEYPGGFMYSRANNPNRQALENLLAALEGGEAAAAFSSGNAAAMAVFQALTPGSHIICPDDMYHGLRNQLKTMFNNILQFDFIDVGNLPLVKKNIKPNTLLIWLETPSNPLLKISDIKAICQLAKKNNLIVAVDNTFATPICQQPLNLGANLVMHSNTKYLNGHSDIVGGALVTKHLNPFWDKIKNIQIYGGAIPSPFDCYLTVRGIKTLPYRMRGHCHNALIIAQYLQNHPKVEAVFYPGLPSHPQHQIAKIQMLAYSAMLSFLVKGGEKAARTIINKLTLFTQATSLGGVESLIEHRYSVEGADSTTPKNLLRVSVGLEHIDDLLADLENAMH
ncbi:MAG: aminotransferase class I/II-fold pyridoxal phosphate-dependent enzyme [Sphingobacteriales bacterium]|nr:MAG: aminotransferase class I/II-fold pyridoxal phosphate-dependent enzyme [Sphingobacteriales bacterium]TAF81757.1 MAG: aminotransferase class I/II-fold pyridoxal phosphate-dependent enzyme [Sphingobacteriales bacterium]